MKILLTVVLLLGIFSTGTKAQNASVEENVWGVQALMLPLSVYNETKLTNSLALRSELAFGLSFTSYSYIESNTRSTLSWAALPFAIVEPRFYYNLNRRVEKGKRIDGNSGNYWSLFACYQPGFGISSGGIDIFPAAYIVPTYGLRRNMGKRFNFEFAVGLGYGWEFQKYDHPDGRTYSNTDSGVLFNSRVAFGYLF